MPSEWTDTIRLVITAVKLVEVLAAPCHSRECVFVRICFSCSRTLWKLFQKPVMRTNLDINIFIKDSVPKYMDVNEHERLFKGILSTSCVIFSYPKLLSISVLIFIKWWFNTELWRIRSETLFFRLKKLTVVTGS